ISVTAHNIEIRLRDLERSWSSLEWHGIILFLQHINIAWCIFRLSELNSH
ncbi:hypothetical protein FRX31_022188, partial [Thalictrum thalictroides]